MYMYECRNLYYPYSSIIILYGFMGRFQEGCDLRLSFLLAMVCILFFCSTAPESGNFVSRSGESWCFPTGWQKKLLTHTPLGKQIKQINILTKYNYIYSNIFYLFKVVIFPYAKVCSLTFCLLINFLIVYLYPIHQ